MNDCRFLLCSSKHIPDICYSRRLGSAGRPHSAVTPSHIPSMRPPKQLSIFRYVVRQSRQTSVTTVGYAADYQHRTNCPACPVAAPTTQYIIDPLNSSHDAARCQLLQPRSSVCIAASSITDRLMLPAGCGSISPAAAPNLAYDHRKNIQLFGSSMSEVSSWIRPIFRLGSRIPGGGGEGTIVASCVPSRSEDFILSTAGLTPAALYPLVK